MTGYVLELVNVFYGFTPRELDHLSYNCSGASLSRHILTKISQRAVKDL
jgi:hypothetical protein